MCVSFARPSQLASWRAIFGDPVSQLAVGGTMECLAHVDGGNLGSDRTKESQYEEIQTPPGLPGSSWLLPWLLPWPLHAPPLAFSGRT